jgi:hypothetical protein
MTVLPIADLTATAILVVAAITLCLALATVALVLVTRAGIAQGREAAKAELDDLRRQVAAGYQPLLVDVLTAAPVPEDMGARLDVEQQPSPNVTVHHPGPVVETKLPGMQPEYFDPRTVFVKVDAAKVFLSVPLRNVGRGLAIIDGAGAGIGGPGIGELVYRAVERYHVPVNETTRIDIITRYAMGEPIPTGTVWRLQVPYVDFVGTQRTVVTLQLVCRGDDAQGPWLVERVEQETAGDRQPHRDEAPTPNSPAQKIEARREQVTDVWGNPVTKRKRRNR